jgi:hypothetical protein
MMVSKYRLYCSNCNSKGKDKNGYVWIPASKVDVKVCLCTDSYEFRARCPQCKNDIFNGRRAF